MKNFLIGILVTLAAGSILANVPNPFPYSTSELPLRTKAEYWTVTAGAAAATLTFGDTTKSILVVNEGANPARFTVNGSTATSTVGVLLNAGASYTDSNWSTTSISHIRTGGADTTLRVQVTY